MIKSLRLKILFMVGVSVFLCSCAKQNYRNTYVAAGAYLEVISPYKDAGKIVSAEFSRLDKILNFYDSNSELSHLNSTYNTEIKVSDELLEVLLLSAQVNKMTEGAFDVTYGNLFNFWKNIIKNGKAAVLPSKEKIAEIKQFCGMEFIEINKEKKTVKLKNASIKIDLGGIACGYMVDKAVEKLKENKIDSAIINAGGDIYCLGKNGPNPWRVGIQGDSDAFRDIVDTEEVVDEAITTSGNYQQYFELNGKKYSHIIDPKTGFPVDNNIVSVTVITKNCTSADSLATAFFVMGLEGIREFIQVNPSTMRVFVLVEDSNGKRNLHILR